MQQHPLLAPIYNGFVRIIGVTNPTGAPVFDFHVDHGVHPDVVMWELGYVQTRPLSATLADQQVVVTMLVRPVAVSDRPQRHRGRAELSAPTSGEVPIVHQRIAAYAVVTSDRGLLGTVCSARTRVNGVWMLPGGGLNPGEAPSEAVLREIYEETGQHARLERLLALQSDHWVGRAPNGVLEDFHALRIIYAATCDRPTDPVVYDHSGTTQSASWVAGDEWRILPWTTGARLLLAQHAGQPS